mmetsp:Transcript_53714/g.128436  ORF Transcript_53714/g.128436 Transcript_53714/m.128436 type:complete len:91 (-) Transcript_53714:296-568(-)
MRSAQRLRIRSLEAPEIRTGERTTWVDVLMALPLVLVVLVVVLAAAMVVVMLVPMQRIAALDELESHLPFPHKTWMERLRDQSLSQDMRT